MMQLLLINDEDEYESFISHSNAKSNRFDHSKDLNEHNDIGDSFVF